MPPKSSRDKSLYKNTIKLDLEKRTNGEIQATKVDLTKIKIKTSAKKVGVSSEAVKNVYAFIQYKEILWFK